MTFLRQSTASQEVLLGPFLDSTDGVTAETGLTIANTDIKVWKRGGTTESNKNSGGATHIASGRYYAVLDATDTDTIGELEINVAVAGALPVKLRCCVLDEAVYDVMFGTTAPSTYAGADTSGTTTLLSRIGSALTITSGRVNADITHIAAAAVSTSTAQLGVNVVNFGGSAGTFASGRPEVNASHFGGAPVTATTSVTFPAASTVATTTGAVGSVTGAVGSVTGAVGSVTGNVGGNVTGSVGSVATGGITSASFAAGAINAAAIAADAIGASELAADAVAEIADAVWDEVLSGHLTAGSTGNALNAAGSAGDPWSTAIPGAYGAGTAGYIVGTNLDATVSSRSTVTTAQVNTEVDTALADINLDHLVKSAVDTNFATTVHLNSVIGHLADNGTTATFDRTTDSLEAVRDNHPANFSGLTITAGVVSADVTQWVGATAPDLNGGYVPCMVEVMQNNSISAAAMSVGATDEIVNAVWNAATASYGTAGSYGALIETNLDAPVSTVDTVVDAIKAKTDQLTFTVANQVDANTESINAVAVVGAGTSLNKWRA